MAKRPLTELMLRYQNAERGAAEELFREVNPVLTRYFRARASQQGMSEDGLQECWLRIHTSRQSYRPGAAVLPWVLSIARNTRVDQFRRWRRTSGREVSIEIVPDAPSSDPRGYLQKRLEAGAIGEAMKSLPDGQREVVWMLKVNGMTAAEVASRTGSTAAAVKQKAFRAYVALRHVIANPVVRRAK
jgi:RNA polymerase sigma-70 factor (ECF subfamily)